MKNRRKFLSALLASTLIVNICLPTLATEIFAGGQDGFGAQINDLGGANVNYNTGTQAQIGITGNGNTIKWDHLNVGADNKLDFNFTQSGQVALNKVNGGVSKFAGTVSTSGENGHLVISNPNGMVFMNGSTINVDAGSVTFTTHDAYFNDAPNGGINTVAKTNNGITIGGGNGPVPVFKVAKDLNIIAPGVDVQGADMFAGGTVRMFSSDGVNFIASTPEPDAIAFSTTQPYDVKYAKADSNGGINYTMGDNNAIKLNNTTVKATNSVATADGRLYLLADGDISLDNVKTGAVDALTMNNLGINNTKIEGTANNSSYIYAGVDINVGDNSDINKVIMDSTGINIDNSIVKDSTLRAISSVSFNESEIKDSKLNSGAAMINNSRLDNVKVDADYLIHSMGNSITASTLNTGGMLNMYATHLKDSTATSGYGFLRAEYGSTIENSYLKSDSNIHINDSIVNDSTVEAVHFYAGRVESKNSHFNSVGDVYFYYGSLLDNITLTGERVWLMDSLVKNSNAVGDDAYIGDSTLQNTNITATNNINISGSTLYGGLLDVSRGNLTIAHSDNNSGLYNFDMSPLTTTDGATNKGYGQKTGAPSVIYGNLNAKAGNLDIANTYITGGLNVNVSGNTSIVYSTVENGNKNAILGYAGNIFESYIGVEAAALPDVQTDNAKVSSASVDEPGQEIGEDIDVIFRKNFTPKSFAASDDEIKQMKLETINNIVKSESGLMHLAKEFRAY